MFAFEGVGAFACGLRSRLALACLLALCSLVAAPPLPSGLSSWLAFGLLSVVISYRQAFDTRYIDIYRIALEGEPIQLVSIC